MSEASQATSMVQGQLATGGITDQRILHAMHSVRREDFLPDRLKASAYVDDDLDIGNGRYFMEPLVFARLLEIAEITASCKVLTVGVLSGYSALVVSRLAKSVTGIESDAALAKKAKENIKKSGAKNVDIQQVKSLADGYPLIAPYDVILINGAIDFVAEELGGQLAMGGRLVAIHQKAVRPGTHMGLGKGILVKRMSNQLQYRECFDAFTALLPGFSRKEGFEF